MLYKICTSTNTCVYLYMRTCVCVLISIDGEWRNNQQIGEGTFTWACGDAYVGQFDCGDMHGRGVLTLVNGDIYGKKSKSD